MQTPIYDYLTELIKTDISRLYMPGHKGRHPDAVFQEISRYDVTEMTGADSLYEAEGIIFQSEENTAALYGSGHTCFSAGGSTLCIQTMLALVAVPGDTVIAGRNAHKAFIHTCALLDIVPFWVKPCYNDSFGVSGELSPEAVEKAIKDAPHAKAVYITSPDYLGCISDVASIAAICHRYHKLLLVDNAHGAHLKFTRADLHPITLGADFCCDSAHKTLPVLTGGSYLHTAKGSSVTREGVKERMSLFGSTSPSYLILLSLDLNNRYLATTARADFAALENTVSELYTLAAKKGFAPISSHCDPTKLTLDGYAAGRTGKELAAHFRRHMVECEYAAARHMVLMLSPQNSPGDIARVKEALATVPQGKPLSLEHADFEIPNAAMSVRDAVFAGKEQVSIDNACGRIAGETKLKCPPGVPIVIAGEIIDEMTQKLLKKSSISSINVVK